MLFWLSQPGNYARLREKRAAGDLDYLVAFRNECLRYCPPVEILPRKIDERRYEAAVRVLPDLEVPALQDDPPMVCPCIHRVHHDPAIHANPGRFEPERFVGSSYRPTEFLPFGLGRRFCLGAGVGQRLMDRVLERLLVRGLRFELQKRAFRPIRRNVIIWPGMFLFAKLRKDTDASA
jgi:cytochrome P450